jgi:hypothetical protein
MRCESEENKEADDTQVSAIHRATPTPRKILTSFVDYGTTHTYVRFILALFGATIVPGSVLPEARSQDTDDAVGVLVYAIKVAGEPT